jgi:cytochrome c553
MKMKKLLIASAVLATSLTAGATHASDAKNGEALVKKMACTSCHGEGMNKPIDPSYPKLAGQYEDYLFVALKSYKTEGNALVGRNHPSMVGFAKQLSNKEMRDIAAYIAKLPGDMKTIQEPKFRIGAGK